MPPLSFVSEAASIFTWCRILDAHSRAANSAQLSYPSDLRSLPKRKTYMKVPFQSWYIPHSRYLASYRGCSVIVITEWYCKHGQGDV